MSDTGGVAPTGCYKCGRPGHWSRDCPSSNPNPNPDSATTPAYTNSFTKSTTSNNSGTFHPKLSASGSAPKPKKVPRTRKITPDLLLSDQGLGYILRYFPKNFKYRGRGHEASDLGNLLRMYAEWHSQLIPYFPFDQFIHKMEDAGSRRVKTCIAELKERVANGGDITKLKESEPENEILHDKEDVMNMDEMANDQDDFPFNSNETDEMHEDIFNEMYNKTTEEATNPIQDDSSVADVPPSNGTGEQSDQLLDGENRSSGAAHVTEEQKARMEAKRLKALERAAAKSRLLKSS